jgi:hypothetical protein
MKVVFVVCLGAVLAERCCGESRAQEKPADTKAIAAELDRFREGRCPRAWLGGGSWRSWEESAAGCYLQVSS